MRRREAHIFSFLIFCGCSGSTSPGAVEADAAFVEDASDPRDATVGEPPPVVIGKLDPEAAMPPISELMPLARTATMTPERVRVAITVDDLGRHGPLIPGLSRIDTGRLFLDTLAAHGVTGVYGFVNAGDRMARSARRRSSSVDA